MLLRRILSLALLVALTASTSAATRWLTEREGAPVRWQAWGPAAFERAKKENRPIFLVIGTASSYEGYRMHREVFLNGEIAEYLNAYFVPVVLDRIEYPEIARAYERIFGKPILLYDIRSKGAEAYLELAKEVMGHEEKGSGEGTERPPAGS